MRRARGVGWFSLRNSPLVDGLGWVQQHNTKLTTHAPVETTHFDGKRFVKDADTRAYQAHGLGRTRRESADCNTLWANGSVCKKRPLGAGRCKQHLTLAQGRTRHPQPLQPPFSLGPRHVTLKAWTMRNLLVLVSTTWATPSSSGPTCSPRCS
eukprot:scaffold10728_cov64-Phaeocystis_antarctica.AAC.1